MGSVEVRETLVRHTLESAITPGAETPEMKVPPSFHHSQSRETDTDLAYVSLVPNCIVACGFVGLGRRRRDGKCVNALSLIVINRPPAEGHRMNVCEFSLSIVAARERPRCEKLRARRTDSINCHLTEGNHSIRRFLL
jgi:hypothetical protein